MTPARIPTAVLVWLVSTALVWVTLDVWTRSGRSPLPLSWSSVIGTGVLTGLVIIAGLPVRAWVRGRRDRVLDPLVAARTAVLAKAGAYGGAGLAGWYLAQGLIVLPELVGARRERFVIAVAAAVAAVTVSVSGFVVQSWCRVPPDDESPGASGLSPDPPSR